MGASTPSYDLLLRPLKHFETYQIFTAFPLRSQRLCARQLHPGQKYLLNHSAHFAKIGIGEHFAGRSLQFG